MDEINILATKLRFPKSPAFDIDGRLWCAEQDGEGLFCLYPNGQTEHFHTGGRPSGLKIDTLGNLWFCDSENHAIRQLKTEGLQIHTVVGRFNDRSLDVPNDLLFDSASNLLFTSPGLPDDDGTGSVAVLSAHGMIHIVADNLIYPNGMAFIPGTATLLIAETKQKRIWSGLWDAQSFSWENIDVWTYIDGNHHGPMGMAFGPDGELYVAVYGSGCIYVYDMEGQFLRSVKLPGLNPTNCIYDPSGRLGLVVTEAEKGQLLSLKLNLC